MSIRLEFRASGALLLYSPLEDAVVSANSDPVAGKNDNPVNHPPDHATTAGHELDDAGPDVGGGAEEPVAAGSAQEHPPEGGGASVGELVLETVAGDVATDVTGAAVAAG